MSPTSYSNVSSAADFSADIQAIDLASQASSGKGTAYTITLAANATLTEAADIEAVNLKGSDTLTIEGQGAALDGAGAHRGLFVYSGTVTIEDLTIQNTVARGGTGSGGGGGGGLGGGLFVADDVADGASAGNVTLRNVDFANDSALGGNGFSSSASSRNTGGGGGGMGGNGLNGGGGIGAGATGGVSISGGFGGGGGTGIVAGAEPGGDNSHPQPQYPGAGAGGADGGGGGGGYVTRYGFSQSSGGGGGGGGVAGTAASALNGGGGGYGGGGGGAGYDFIGASNQPGADQYVNSGGAGGTGGFGGGGGGGALGRSNTHGGEGGFGGGGGAIGGLGGFGGGNGGKSGATAGGGGGLGAGGDIFVQGGASLTILGGSLTGGSVAGGTGGNGATDGQALGSGIFLQGDQSVTFGAGQTAGQVTDIEDVIADQTGSGGTGANAGAGSVVIAGAGVVKLGGNNSYTGGTTIQNGTLELAAASAAGSGPITFIAGHRAMLELDAAALPATGGTFAVPIAGFGASDTIDLTSLAFVSGATATLSSGVLAVTSGGKTDTFSSVGLAAGFRPNATLYARSDGKGGTAVTTLQVTFSGLTVGSGGHLTFSGAVTPGVSGVAVAVYNGTTKIGVASVNATAGTWSLTIVPPAGTYKYPNVVATNVGQDSVTATPSFTFVAGVANQPYATLVDTVDATGAIVTAQHYYTVGGSLYIAMTVSNGAGGTTVHTFSGGSFFTGKPFTAYVNTYDSGSRLLSTAYYGITGQPYTSSLNVYDTAGHLSAQSHYGFTGRAYTSDLQTFAANGSLDGVVQYVGSSIYLAERISGLSGGLTVDVFYAGTALAGEPYSSLERIYDSASRLVEDAYYGVTGQPFTSYLDKYDAAGQLANEQHFGYTGRPYTSDVITYAADGSVSGIFQYDNASLYLAEQIAHRTGGITADVYYAGTVLAGRPYSSYEDDFQGGKLIERQFLGIKNQPYSSYDYLYDAAGKAASQITNYSNGAHALQGFENGVTLTSLHNDSMTGNGSGQTFVFSTGYGHDTVNDLYKHLTDAAHDTVSFAMSEFHNFQALLAATATVGGNAVITGAGGDQITLVGVTRDLIAANPGEFSFHA